MPNAASKMKPAHSSLGIKSTTGIGKSHITRKLAAEKVRELRASGNTQSIAIFVPTLELAREQVEKFKKEHPSISVTSFIGLSNANPDKPGHSMCEKSGPVNELINMGVSMNSLCGTSAETGYCKHHCNVSEDPCGYSVQKNTEADVVYFAHQYLTQPNKTINSFHMVCIDESFWEILIQNQKSFKLDELVSSGLYQSGTDSGYTHTCKVIHQAIKSIPQGEYIDVSIIDELLNGEGIGDCFKVLEIERGELITPMVTPSMSNGQLQDLAKDCKDGRTAARMNFWWILAKAMNNGGLAPYIRKTGNDSLELNTKKAIHGDWKLPTLLVDATLPQRFNQMVIPNLRIESLQCPMQYTTVTQIHDKKMSKAALLSSSTACDRKNKERKSNLNKVISICRVIVSRHSKGVVVPDHTDPVKLLLISNKAVINALKDIGLPPEVTTLHFGATSGIDAYGSVPSLLIVGRMQIAPKDAEHLASLLSGLKVKSVVQNTNGYYPESSKEVSLIGQPNALLKSPFHPDPLVEEVRWSKSEGELLQAIGRARAIRRTKDNPLEINILTNVPLPIEINYLSTWGDMVPTELESVLADRGAVALAYNELIRTNPETINTISKARTAVTNFQIRYPELNLSVKLPICNIYRQNRTQFKFFNSLLLVQYTRTVKGSKPCKAVIHDHPSVSWREALKSVAGDVKIIALISRTAANSRITTRFKVKDLVPTSIASKGLLTKPRLNLA